MRCGAHVRGFPLTCFWRFVQRLGLCSGAIFKLPSPGQHPFQRDDRGMETRGHKRKMRGGNIGCAGGMSSCKHGGRVNVRIQTSKAQHPFKGAHMQIPSITPHVKAQRWFDSAAFLLCHVNIPCIKSPEACFTVLHCRAVMGPPTGVTGRHVYALIHHHVPSIRVASESLFSGCLFLLLFFFLLLRLDGGFPVAPAVRGSHRMGEGC